MLYYCFFVKMFVVTKVRLLSNSHLNSHLNYSISKSNGKIFRGIRKDRFSLCPENQVIRITMFKSQIEKNHEAQFRNSYFKKVARNRKKLFKEDERIRDNRKRFLMFRKSVTLFLVTI